MINEPVFNYSTEVINENDAESFEKAVTEKLNKGYVLAASNTTFDSNGKQWFYALLYFSNKIERTPLGFQTGK
jgi:hypothetical protein